MTERGTPSSHTHAHACCLCAFAGNVGHASNVHGGIGGSLEQQHVGHASTINGGIQNVENVESSSISGGIANAVNVDNANIVDGALNVASSVGVLNVGNVGHATNIHGGVGGDVTQGERGAPSSHTNACCP